MEHVNLSGLKPRFRISWTRGSLLSLGHSLWSPGNLAVLKASPSLLGFARAHSRIHHLISEVMIWKWGKPTCINCIMAMLMRWCLQLDRPMLEISDPIMVTRCHQIGRGSNFWPLAFEGTTMNYGSDGTGLFPHWVWGAGRIECNRIGVFLPLLHPLQYLGWGEHGKKMKTKKKEQGLTLCNPKRLGISKPVF